MNDPHTLVRMLVFGATIAVAGCGEGPTDLGRSDATILNEDGDDAAPLDNVVYIRRVGVHPIAPPIFGENPYPNGLDRGARDDFTEHHCGGVLVADDWVLTAAHCLYYGFPTSPQFSKSYLFRLDQFEVVFGKRSLKGLDARAQRRAPVLMQFHPSALPFGIGTEVERTDWFGMDWQCEYPTTIGGGTPLSDWQYDAVLIKLGHPFEGATPVSVAATVNPTIPIKSPDLPQDDDGPLGGDNPGAGGGDGPSKGDLEVGNTTAALELPVQASGKFRGWGRTADYVYRPHQDDYGWAHRPRSNDLRYYWGKPIADDDCHPAMQSVLNPTKICVQADNGGGTLSLGDSGGPFIINKKIVGIAHIGVQDRPNAAGYSVYTSGPAIRAWVEQTLAGPGVAYAPKGCPSAGSARTNDCRLTGCDEGFHCHDCPTFECVPENYWCY